MSDISIRKSPKPTTIPSPTPLLPGLHGGIKTSSLAFLFLFGFCGYVNSVVDHCYPLAIFASNHQV